MSKKLATPTVDDFLKALEHAQKPTVLLLRDIILGADARIGEEIKWNAPSFRLDEHFATMQLRSPKFVQLILHFGAKKREVANLDIADPTGLLEWLGPDRATIKFGGVDDLESKRAALTELIREWIRFL